MPSAFDALDQIASGYIDQQYSERVLILPRLSGEHFAGAPDASRQEFEARGVPDFMPTVSTSTDERRHDQYAPQFAAHENDISFDEHWFANRFVPKQGDVIRFLDIAGQPEFRVSHEMHDGGKRHIIKVVKL